MEKANRATVAGSGDWFVRRDDHLPHLVGWMNTAIKTLPTGGWNDDGWLALAICPRCHVLVLADEGHAFGSRVDKHERWHAETDHPVPVELLQEVPR